MNPALAGLVDGLRQLHLLDAAQLDGLASAVHGRVLEPKDLAQELLQRGWLTPYQANQLLQGKGQELLVGSYVLLDKVGEGGMGVVFKARNWKLGKIVAVKLIRKERLDSSDAVRRFQREMRAAARLNHPNIVHAYDADEVSGNLVLIMEYVDGINLSRLVKQRGPLPVAMAGDYIRQAALGLQHAFEHHMVHRDIKPHNLLIEGRVPSAECRVEDRVQVSPSVGNRQSAFGNLKILDMGVARIADGSESTGTVTKEGGILGTPDYIAPEQALESHHVDIRADLYSLGSTFYFLLTGRVPFPGGSVYDKMHRLQFEEPVPVESLSPGTSVALAALVRKLMAKRADDRFQTPAEFLVALRQVLSTLTTTPAPAAVDSVPTARAARLVVLEGQKTHTAYPLHDGANYLGRSTEQQRVDVDLTDQGPGVSRLHAVVTLQGAALLIQDLNSTNGTFVNQVRLQPSQWYTLNREDVIRVGLIQLQVR